MKTIKIGDKEYTLEFTFEAAECKGLVQSMFNVLSGAYILRNVAGAVGGTLSKEEENTTTFRCMIDGSSEMIADIPHICRIGFYAGLLENNEVSEDEAKELMKQYMKENKISFHGMYELLKQCMEDDGFFDLSGLTEMIQKMNEQMESSEEENVVEENAKAENKKVPKQKSQTSTK